MRRKKSTYHPTTSFLQKYSNENEDPTTSKKKKKAAATYHCPPHAKKCDFIVPKQKKSCLPCTQFYQDPVFREIQKKKRNEFCI